MMTDDSKKILELFPTLENAAENMSLLEQIGIPVDQVKGIFVGETEYFTGLCKGPGKTEEDLFCATEVSLQRDRKGRMTVFFDGVRWDEYFEKLHREAEETKSFEEILKENKNLRCELSKLAEFSRHKDSIIEELETLVELKDEKLRKN